MLVSELDFALPNELIATGPLPSRGKDARLLVLHRKDGKIEHRQFPDVVEYLKGQPVYVNNARLFRGDIDVWEPRGHSMKASLRYRFTDLRWETLIRGDERLIVGKDLTLVDGTTMHVRGGKAGRYLVEFDVPPDLESIGAPVSLPWCKPPAMREWHSWYEPVYAQVTGTASSPGAGIHFTEEMLAELDVRELTLQPDDRTPYTMTAHTVGYHEGLLLPEPYEIPDPPAGPVTAIGTTVAKTLETYARFKEAKGESRLFIHGEDFDWKLTSKLLTCFSFPREITLALHVAFGGLEKVMRAYRAAIEENYRWNAYGDSLLML